MKKRTKLLILYPANDLGGGAQYILSIVRFLPREEFETHVAVHGRGPLRELLHVDGVIVHELKIDYSVLTLFPTILELRQFLRVEQFDIVHAHTAKGGLLCCLAARSLPTKVVYTGHVLKLAESKRFPLSVVFASMERFIYRSSDISTLLCKSECDYVLSNRSLASERAAVVSMSIDVSRFSGITADVSRAHRAILGIPEGAFIVGMIGRITHQKNPEAFLEIARILNSQIEESYFLWIGDGDLKNEIIKKSREYGLQRKFLVTGHRDTAEMPELLSIIDVVLFTSIFEGLPIALVEAMAARKLIVASNVGGVPDLIKEGITGWLFRPDDLEAAASMVNHIYRNLNTFDSVKKASFMLVSREYAPKDKMSNEFRDIYRRVSCNC